jgi:hypothetical protein
MIAQQAEAACHFVVNAGFRLWQADNARNSEALLRILRSSSEPVMSENMTVLYKAGKQVPFEPAIIAALAAMGSWDETPLIDLISRRAFSVMIIQQVDGPVRYSPAAARAIKEYYDPAEKYGQLTVYRPRE